MTILTASLPPVNTETADAPADVEPIGPAPADTAWWSGQNADWHDQEGAAPADDESTNAQWDEWAEESAQTDRLCAGYCC